MISEITSMQSEWHINIAKENGYLVEKENSSRVFIQLKTTTIEDLDDIANYF